jgi:hypothetical protein
MRAMAMRTLSVLVFVVACGGGKGGGTFGSSGVDSTKLVSALSSAEITKICNHLVPFAPEPGTISCPDGDLMIDETTVAECEAGIADDQAQFVSCGITVGEYEDCLEALLGRSDAELCDNAFPPECDALLECMNTPTPDPPPEPQPGS